MLSSNPLLEPSSLGSALLVCFSHLRWNFVYQRPQHLLSRAARDQQVLFVEEPVFERDCERPKVRIEPQPCGVIVVVPVLKEGATEDEQITAQLQMIDRLLERFDAAKTTFWYYTPMALQFTAHIQPELCVYDCMDELSAFKNAPPRLARLERQLLDRADLVFTGGHSLYRSKRDKHHNCHVFPSSVDTAHFARARSMRSQEPADQAAIAHPRVGFFGVIDERMDLQLLADLADLRPDLQFVIIGPVVKIDPATLPQRSNIHWLGMKRYADLPDYLAGWDAALMPFALNESTRFISPTKTPEFLAAGVPVCSTPITDVISPYGEIGLVEIASDASTCSRKLDLLLARRNAKWLERVDEFVSTMSWDKTWAQMSLLMERNSRLVDEDSAATDNTRELMEHDIRLIS